MASKQKHEGRRVIFLLFYHQVSLNKLNGTRASVWGQCKGKGTSPCLRQLFGNSLRFIKCSCIHSPDLMYRDRICGHCIHTDKQHFTHLESSITELSLRCCQMDQKPYFLLWLPATQKRSVTSQPTLLHIKGKTKWFKQLRRENNFHFLPCHLIVKSYF